MNEGGVKSALRHQGHGAMGDALPFAANSENVNVVAHQMGPICLNRFKGKSGQTNWFCPKIVPGYLS